MKKQETQTCHSINQVPCWKSIGVWGTKRPRCKELEQAVHCRNCDVFTQTGRNLLETDLSDEYMEEWTEILCAKKEEELLGTISILIFRVAGEWLAFSAHLFDEILDVDETLDAGHIHTLPHRKNSALIGLINVHGEVELCVSLKLFLNLQDTVNKKTEKRRYMKRMIVMNHEDYKWVFPVNEILGIYRIHPNTLEDPPATVSNTSGAYTKKILKKDSLSIGLLDHELLFYNLTKSVK